MKKIQTVPNRAQQRDYNVHIEFPEFTCVCPRTSLPDFATIIIDYVPDKKLIELKSLKLYFVSYRNMGIFHEFAINKILDDLVAAAKPQSMKVVGEFSVRGGIYTTVEANFSSPS